MRKVQVFKYAPLAPDKKELVGTADFHCWGKELEECEGFHERTVAVVEFPDGRVDTVCPAYIQFLPEDTCVWVRKLNGDIVNPHSNCVFDYGKERCNTCGKPIEVMK